MSAPVLDPPPREKSASRAGRIRVLVADDHEVVRRGVRNLLEAKGYEVVGEAVDGLEALAMLQHLAPDIVVLDIGMPLLNGLDVARRIRKTAPRTEILILSMHYSEQTVRDVLETGASGYVLKSDGGAELIAAIEALAAHRPYFTSDASRQVLDGYFGQEARVSERQPSKPTLTMREREIVQLLAQGKSNKEVAALLDVSVKTVETHRSNLMRKLGLHGLSGVIHYALRNNLIAP